MRNFFFLIIFSLCICSCDPDKVYESNVKIPSAGWQRTDIASFNVEIVEIDVAYNIYVNVRNNNNYKYRDLWLFIDVDSPMGYVERDTVKIMLADHRGKWLGHGLGSKFNTRLILHENVRFPATGKYNFRYEQAMRDEPLIGIEDIGLRIEKAN